MADLTYDVVIIGGSLGFDDMSFRPNVPLTTQDQQDIEGAIGRQLNWPSNAMTRRQAAQWLVQQLQL